MKYLLLFSLLFFLSAILLRVSIKLHHDDETIAVYCAPFAPKSDFKECQQHAIHMVLG